MYFNEHDKFAAQWLRNLFPAATVDERDIRDVTADDVVRFRRVHFFGGIAGWECALQLAGWGDGEVWTGSCPCQPFSSAGKRKGTADERHLWPAWFRLIRECRPQRIFGEQVESAIGHGWLDGVSADLEAEGYAVGAAVLGAHSVGAPHIRQRLYWVAESESAGGRSHVGTVRSRKIEGLRNEEGQDERRAGEQTGRVVDCCTVDGLVHAEVNGWNEGRAESNGRNACAIGALEWLDDAAVLRQSRCDGSNEQLCGPWTASIVIPCGDKKYRRISSQRSDEPLAHGIPRDLGRRIPELRSVAASARANRVGRLRGYGNAIVPQVAAEFIQAYMEVISPTA